MKTIDSVDRNNTLANCASRYRKTDKTGSAKLAKPSSPVSHIEAAEQPGKDAED